MVVCQVARLHLISVAVGSCPASYGHAHWLFPFLHLRYGSVPRRWGFFIVVGYVIGLVVGYWFVTVHKCLRNVV